MFRLCCRICVTWQSHAAPPSSHSDSYHSCQTSLHGEILPTDRHAAVDMSASLVFFVPLFTTTNWFKKKKKKKGVKVHSRGVKPRSFVSTLTSCRWGFRLVSEDFYKKWHMAAGDRKRAVCRCCQRHWPDKPQHLELPQICKDKRNKTHRRCAITCFLPCRGATLDLIIACERAENTAAAR